MEDRVIFLDIDGVLNSESWYARCLREYNTDTSIGILEQRAIFLLNELVARTHAKIVLSSSWRISDYAREKVKQNLAPYELEIWDYTAQDPTTRGGQIHMWLVRHPKIEYFVVLDDEPIEGYVGDHLVQTDGMIGLQWDDVVKAEAILYEKFI